MDQDHIQEKEIDSDHSDDLDGLILISGNATNDSNGEDLNQRVASVTIDLDVEISSCDEVHEFLTGNIARLSMSDLFNVVSSWIEFHSSSESIATDGYSLLSLLDFASIPANVFASCFPRLKSLCTYKKCQQLFTKILEYNASIYAQPILERPPVNQVDTLLDEEVFVVLGGIQLEGPGYYVQSKIQYLHPVTSEWSKLTDLPEPMFGQCVTFLDNFLYVAGGSNYQTPMSSQLSQEMHRYNIQTGEWLFVAPMMEKRMGFSMTAVGNKLYVIGGLNQSCLLDSLECYDPAANTWSYVHHLEEPLFLHAAVAYKDKLYLSGGSSQVAARRSIIGFTRQELLCKNDLKRYDPSVNEWELLRPMLKERALHMMQVLGNAVFVIGGRDSTGAPCLNIDIYLPATDSWSSVQIMLPVEKMWFGCSVHNNKIYLCGGLDGKEGCVASSMMFEHNRHVQCYDSTTESWQNVADIENLLIPLCCSIRIPKWRTTTGVQGFQLTSNLTLDIPTSVASNNSHGCDSVISEMSEKKEQDYGDKFLAGLMQLYCSNDLSDVVIFINNQRFPAHRAILATCSDYFRAMFTGGMKESVDNEQEVELHDMSMEGLKAVLEFMYTGKTTLNHRNSDTILAVANYLQVQPLVCLCISFLVDELVEENMMEVVALTTAYGLLEKFTRYEKVIDMFVAMVTRQDALLELSDLTAEQLMAFLQSKWMETHSPLQRFKVLVSWLERQNVTVKEDVINRAINYMPLNEMSVDDLLTHVKPVQSLDTEHCQQLIIDALVHHTSDTPVVVSSDHSYSVETEQVIVAIGGFETTNEGKTIKNYICYYDCHTNHWHKLSDMPIERLAYGAVLLNNHIYIVGGENYHCSDIDPSGCQFSTRTVYCFDLQLKQWRNVASMLESRTDFCVVTLHGYIYAIGGRNSRHPTGINSVERYDPSTNSWSYVAPLVRALFASAGAVYKDQIYISGGCFYTDRLIYTNALLYYNPKTNQWGEASAMSAAFPIAWHSMTSAGDKLYVLGGQQVELEEMDTKCSYSLKCYDPKLDRWSKCKDMPSHGSKDASCIINAYRSVYKDGKLYCIDGELTESTFIVQKYVHCYDIAQDAWSDGPCLPQDGFQSLVIANLSTYMIKHERRIFQEKLAEQAMDVSSCNDVELSPGYPLGEAITDRNFTCEHHGLSLLHGLSGLYDERQLCDVSMVTTSENIRVHGVLLAALQDNKSPKSEEAEVTKTKTNRYQSCDANKTVELYELSTSYLSILVHILYNGRLPVGYHGNGLDDLLEAAEKLGLQAAVDVLKAHCSQNDMAV